MKDQRPDPKPRKHPQLWQAYLWWYELMEMRKRHRLRISSAERGKSNFSADFERFMIEMTGLDMFVDPKNKKERANSHKQMMVNYGKAVGPIWDWCLSHKGLGESLAAQLLAQVDDIGNFATIAKLWRFCGYGTFEYWVDGKGNVKAPIVGHKWINKEKIWTIVKPKSEWNGHTEALYNEPEPDWKLVRHRDVNISGYHSPYNRILKAVCFNIADQFIKQQSPPWVDIYYAEKVRQREKHPTAICRTCGAECLHEQKINEDGKLTNVFTCPTKKSHKKYNYTDAHIHNIAWRKMIKDFLAEFWLTWREYEGLEATEDYEARIGV